jgi:hypothetical protein
MPAAEAKKVEPSKEKPANGTHAKPAEKKPGTEDLPKPGTPRRGGSAAVPPPLKKTKEDEIAKALADMAGQVRASDEEEDITSVNEIPQAIVEKKKPQLTAEEAAVLKEMATGQGPNETDEFLAAFEREFEDIKKG